MSWASKWPAVAAAAVATLASAADAQPRRALAELGRFEPPAYAAPLVRRGDPSPVFDDAIDAYRRRQYARAADVFRRFVTVEPEDPAGNFFLAATLMMTDEVGEADDRLGVVLANETTPFEMAARFVLAKARIRVGDLERAEQELTRVARSSDSYARQAAELVERVRALKKRK
jgi:predicted Zn-dependent protease